MRLNKSISEKIKKNINSIIVEEIEQEHTIGQRDILEFLPEGALVLSEIMVKNIGYEKKKKRNVLYHSR